MESSDEKYFSEYEDLEVHELMLRDRPRQEAYYNAIMKNKSLFKNKVVLDVGAGTGILSAMCAKAGAIQVYAIEASNLAKLAIELIEENHLTAIVKVIQCRIEDFQLPAGCAKVDIIVSEWMGFYLLHEGMLDSVIYARDNLLKEDGLLFPQYATIYVAPCSVPQYFDYWENVDGITMVNFGKRIREKKSQKPEIMEIQTENLLHPGTVFTWINLNTVQSEELNEIHLQEVIPIQRVGKHQGYCIWFDCSFPSSSEGDEDDAVKLSTCPGTPLTHWKQCVILLPDNGTNTVECGEPIGLKLTMRRNSKDKRKYDLEIEQLNPGEIDHPLPCECYMTKCILTRAHLKSIENGDQADEEQEDDCEMT